eukprot:scaffold237636_cov18-Tisochrysis_lutea.AAC.1
MATCSTHLPLESNAKQIAEKTSIQIIVVYGRKSQIAPKYCCKRMLTRLESAPMTSSHRDFQCHSGSESSYVLKTMSRRANES